MGGRLVHTMALFAQVARVAQLIRALSSACVDGQRLADSAVPASSCTFGAEAPVLLLATTRGSNLVSETLPQRSPTMMASSIDLAPWFHPAAQQHRRKLHCTRIPLGSQFRGLTWPHLHLVAELASFSVSWADLAASAPGGRVGQLSKGWDAAGSINLLLL